MSERSLGLAGQLQDSCSHNEVGDAVAPAAALVERAKMRWRWCKRRWMGGSPMLATAAATPCQGRWRAITHKA